MIFVGLGLTILLSILLLCRHGNTKLMSEYKVSNISFFSLLFTTGLDGGLIFLPLLDFAKYADSVNYPELSFASPLVIEFGFWAIFSWLCYFVTVCYFALYEPELKVFERPWVKFINNGLILLTCAFTAWLLYSNITHYLSPNWPFAGQYFLDGLVISVISLAVISSARIRFIKILSVISVALFLVLMLAIACHIKMCFTDFVSHTFDLTHYFSELDKFVWPQNSYHEFYLYWWFAWSIMIGQFTAQFVKGIKVYKLLAAILIFPSIPIAVWFILLYDLFLLNSMLDEWILIAFIAMGALFVVNSMDSLIRLYSINLGLSKEKLGTKVYHLVHIALLFAITLLFDVQVLNIELVGAVVLSLWLVAFYSYYNKTN